VNLDIRTLVVGFCDTNCYVTADRESGDALIIDPGDSADEIYAVVSGTGLTVRGIVNTHCHTDHILANGELKDRFHCPLMIHEADAPGLTDPTMNLATLVGYRGPTSPPADRLLRDGDEITFGEITFQVIHTPGHTPGCICLYTPGVLMSGDTLFASGIGRTDFPGGNYEQILDSIRRRLMILPPETQVYPGHGPSTTIGRESG
jgi:glyoxylase-like metal-dependent hydrolase (beta-lactamase superfamily II)